MSGTSCARAWQAEAIEDGRLSRADSASFERHAASCSTCAAEVRALAELRAAALRTGAFEKSPLEHRRERQLLLRRAHELGLEPPRTARRALVVAIGVAAVAAALAVALGPRSAAVDPAPVATPRFELEASPGARHRALERGATVRLALEHGRFELEVYKLLAGQRFLLALPDGELEVQGTHFVVEVEDERTRRVSVSEGRVALRLNRRAPLSLGAGEEFRLEPPAPRASPPSSAPSSGHPPPRAIGSAPRRSTAPGGAAAPSASVSSTPGSSISSTPGSDFALAMKAFRDGDYGRAEQAFLDFERGHPSDARVEDATFLRAVARARRGDEDGARRIAKTYLERYPNGLRRREAEQLAR